MPQIAIVLLTVTLVIGMVARAMEGFKDIQLSLVISRQRASARISRWCPLKIYSFLKAE